MSVLKRVLSELNYLSSHCKPHNIGYAEPRFRAGRTRGTVVLPEMTPDLRVADRGSCWESGDRSVS